MRTNVCWLLMSTALLSAAAHFLQCHLFLIAGSSITSLPVFFFFQAAMADTRSRKKKKKNCAKSTVAIPIKQFSANWVMIVTFMCAHGPTHSHNTWALNIANVWLPYTKLQGAITLILRHESKFFQVKFLV